MGIKFKTATKFHPAKWPNESPVDLRKFTAHSNLKAGIFLCASLALAPGNILQYIPNQNSHFLFASSPINRDLLRV
jgi:hypothetical protein